MFRKLILLLAAPVVVGAQQMTDTTFHPITITDAVRLARENNVANITAANTVRSANYSVRSARAAMFPTLNATASQTKTAGDQLGQNGTIVPFTSAWRYNTGLNSGVTLFDAGKMFADIRNQQANVAAAQAAEVNTEFSVGLNVKLAYNSILAAKESEAAARAQLEAAQAQLQTSIAKVQAGAANVSDSLRSVVQVGNAQLALLTAQNNYRVQSAALTRLVGTAYFVTADLADTVDHPVAPIDSAAIMAMALAGPPIHQLEAQATAASAAQRSAKAAYLPTITANFNYAGNGTSAVYGLNSNPFPYSRSIGINLNYPIFNRFARENQIAAAQINYENAQASIKDARLGAQQNIITDIATMRNNEEAMRVQQQNVRASEEDLRVQQQRYNLGASTLLDVLNSQTALVTARQALIQARLNYRNARAQIEAVIGKDLP
ncbi:MAG TPA: TolC family protein [Gemmatimonadaceae bacterium]|jgi:outer membrane protein|nr:TolC family protein [Gemmatimonadaceae bacterium]